MKCPIKGTLPSGAGASLSPPANCRTASIQHQSPGNSPGFYCVHGTAYRRRRRSEMPRHPLAGSGSDSRQRLLLASIGHLTARARAHSVAVAVNARRRGYAAALSPPPSSSPHARPLGWAPACAGVLGGSAACWRRKGGSRPRPLRWGASHPPPAACWPHPCPPGASACRRPPRPSPAGLAGVMWRPRPGEPGPVKLAASVARGHPSAPQGQAPAGRTPCGLAPLLPLAGCGVGAAARARPTEWG